MHGRCWLSARPPRWQVQSRVSTPDQIWCQVHLVVVFYTAYMSTLASWPPLEIHSGSATAWASWLPHAWQSKVVCRINVCWYENASLTLRHVHVIIFCEDVFDCLTFICLLLSWILDVPGVLETVSPIMKDQLLLSEYWNLALAPNCSSWSTLPKVLVSSGP
jgi:hypothetical protein